ncbi:hypothetical protein BC830DRAFT_141572 [Chytriomyces sp. MP71]|nr:hypothetical protein BC830DRAFT_141572 [Chytriomyces sp. MP71]
MRTKTMTLWLAGQKMFIKSKNRPSAVPVAQTQFATHPPTLKSNSEREGYQDSDYETKKGGHSRIACFRTKVLISPLQCVRSVDKDWKMTTSLKAWAGSLPSGRNESSVACIMDCEIRGVVDHNMGIIGLNRVIISTTPVDGPTFMLVYPILMFNKIVASCSSHYRWGHGVCEFLTRAH